MLIKLSMRRNSSNEAETAALTPNLDLLSADLGAGFLFDGFRFLRGQAYRLRLEVVRLWKTDALSFGQRQIPLRKHVAARQGYKHD